MRAIEFSIALVGLNFLLADCTVFAQGAATQKAPSQSKSDVATNDGAIVTSDQAAKPELVLRRDKWMPMIWFVIGAVIALLIMYYAVRIFRRPTSKK